MQGRSRKQGFLHTVAVRARPCNKVAASAHDMGSGRLAVDAVAIGCLGGDRRATVNLNDFFAPCVLSV
jgi:hypothetical protein